MALSDVRTGYVELCEEIQRFAESRPNVENVDKLYRRAARDVAAINAAIQNENQIEGSVENGVGGKDENAAVIQGFINNLGGMSAELQVAKDAPNVTAVSKRFQILNQCTHISGENSNGNSGLSNKPLKIEVDIVAQNGHCWIEVKNHKSFDLDSVHWLGQPGHQKGLEQQIKEYLTVANSQNNWQRWAPPSVLLYFPEGISEAVANEIQRMGAYVVSGPGPVHLDCVPPPPAPPVITNIDVTAMCALVSEVSHGGPENPQVIKWAERISHWQECLEYERQEAILPQLEPAMANNTVVTSESACAQFEDLLSKFSGEKEMARWQALKSKLKIYPQGDKCVSERVRAIPGLPAIQQDVFGLGDHLKALTVTANAKAVQRLLDNGVNLEVLIHRAVWLTGM